MVEAATKLPVKTEEKDAKPSGAPSVWRPLENLRREIDHLFEDFDRGIWLRPLRRSVFDIHPLWPRETSWNAPAVDLVEKDNSYEATAELPGIDQKNVEVTLRNGSLVIKGEKQEEKEEEKQDYYLHERQFGSFERSFSVPEGVDADKIEATFKNGVLKVILPKTAAAQKPAKKIDVKAA